MPFFNYERETVNYTVVTGPKTDHESRVLLKDALMSTVNSVNYRLLPHELLFDQRGTIYFFITLIKGAMFDVSLEKGGSKTIVNNCEYAQWDCRLQIPDEYKHERVPDENNNMIPFLDVFYWFGEFLRVEIINITYFKKSLDILENSFNKLDGESLLLFGKEWSSENFPKTMGEMPKFRSEKKK